MSLIDKGPLGSLWLFSAFVILNMSKWCVNEILKKSFTGKFGKFEIVICVSFYFDLCIYNKALFRCLSSVLNNANCSLPILFLCITRWQLGQTGRRFCKAFSNDWSNESSLYRKIGLM